MEGASKGPTLSKSIPPRSTADLVRKCSCDGVGYSVVELNDVRHVLAAAVPRKGDTLAEQADDALRTIEAVLREEATRGSIVNQAVFYSDPEHLNALRHIIRDFYGGDLPATTYVPQRPCDGRLLAIEALGVGRNFGEVEIVRRSEQVVIARHNNIAWVHCGQVAPSPSAEGVFERSLSCFRQMRDLLDREGIGFEQVIRTWLYLGDIVGPEGPVQRYQELNRARSEFYRDYRFGRDPVLSGRPGEGRSKAEDVATLAGFPASTGIGSDNNDVLMSCIAFQSERTGVVVTPLENPRQTSAFDYPTVYSPKSPQFSRAMALSCGRYATIFVSGTASITQSETQHVGDAAAQTRETLENIEALISDSNLARHGLPGHGATLEGLGFIRVYIKRQEDYERVRAVCQSRLGDLPTIYAIADVCRPDLLVEIEGMAFSALRDG